MCMIEDVKRQFKSPVSKTIVVVAPRILLANQLCSEFLEQNLDGNYNVGVDVIHVHSGETHFYSTTKSDNIKQWYHNSTKHIIMFTTYHSLHKIQDTLDVEVDTIYFDESHNAVLRRTLLKQLSIIQFMLHVVTSLQLHQNILSHLSKLV